MTKKIPAIWITLKTAVKVNPYQDKFWFSLQMGGRRLVRCTRLLCPHPHFFATEDRSQSQEDFCRNRKADYKMYMKMQRIYQRQNFSEKGKFS